MRTTLDEKQIRQSPQRSRISDGSKSWQVPNGTIGNAEKNKISDENEGWQRHKGRKRDLNVKSGWQKPSVTIIGDSMLRNVKKKDINDEVKNVRCYIKSFSGAKVEDMESYSQPTINLKPDGIDFMFGTNNLRTDSPKQIAENIMD